jgi:hypothetical protein
MTFPTGTVISTANVASSTSNPSLARADIYDLITAVNSIIASYNEAQGVLVLSGTGKVSSEYLPANIVVTGNLQLQPTTGVVNIQNVLRLAQINTVSLGSLSGTASPTAGDMVYLLDGDRGNPCLGVYNGTAWKIVRLATTVGSAGAAITARVTLTATAVP